MKVRRSWFVLGFGLGCFACSGEGSPAWPEGSRLDGQIPGEQGTAETDARAAFTMDASARDSSDAASDGTVEAGEQLRDARDGQDAAVDASSDAAPDAAGDADGDVADGATDAAEDAVADAAEAEAEHDSAAAEAGAEHDSGVGEACEPSARHALPGDSAVDVVMLLDTSGSMLHASTQVTQNISSFLSSIESTPHDLHLVMVTSSDPGLGLNLGESYLFAQSEVDSGELFSTALDTYDRYGDFIRPGAITHFVMITDDNDVMAPETFRAEMEAKLGQPFIQHAIASEDVMGGPCISETQAGNSLCIPGQVIPSICGAAAIGTAYYDLADTTGGETVSVCAADWGPVMDNLASAIADSAGSVAACSVPVASWPALPSDLGQVQLWRVRDGQAQQLPFVESAAHCGDQAAWHYDHPATRDRLELCPTACDALAGGDSLELAFGCAPE